MLKHRMSFISAATDSFENVSLSRRLHQPHQVVQKSMKTSLFSALALARAASKEPSNQAIFPWSPRAAARAGAAAGDAAGDIRAARAMEVRSMKWFLSGDRDRAIV